MFYEAFTFTGKKEVSKRKFFLIIILQMFRVVCAHMLELDWKKPLAWQFVTCIFSVHGKTLMKISLYE